MSDPSKGVHHTSGLREVHGLWLPTPQHAYTTLHGVLPTLHREMTACDAGQRLSGCRQLLHHEGFMIRMCLHLTVRGYC